jgi:hypothetical protein
MVRQGLPLSFDIQKSDVGSIKLRLRYNVTMFTVYCAKPFANSWHDSSKRNNEFDKQPYVSIMLDKSFEVIYKSKTLHLSSEDIAVDSMLNIL